jgi:hypothetical protein
MTAAGPRRRPRALLHAGSHSGSPMATRRGRERKNTLNETPINYPKSRDSSDPLGSVTDGRLRFPSGASNVTVHTELSTADLYRAGFECPLPSFRVEGGRRRDRVPLDLIPSIGASVGAARAARRDQSRWATWEGSAAFGWDYCSPRRVSTGLWARG